MMVSLMCSPPLMEESHFPGSETESEAALDKEYWVNRAGEVRVQWCWWRV